MFGKGGGGFMGTDRTCAGVHVTGCWRGGGGGWGCKGAGWALEYGTPDFLEGILGCEGWLTVVVVS